MTVSESMLPNLDLQILRLIEKDGFKILRRYEASSKVSTKADKYAANSAQSTRQDIVETPAWVGQNHSDFCAPYSSQNEDFTQ